MTDFSFPFDRRRFLKLGGSGAVALAAGGWRRDATWPSTAAPVVLRSPRLTVTLDRERGLPIDYRLTATGARFRGEDASGGISATICDRSAWRFAAVPVTATAVDVATSRADFHFTVSNGARDAASFVVRYELAGPTVTVTLRDVRERAGFELIDVAMPHLVSLREEDGPVWFAHGDDGGNVVSLRDATVASLPPNRFWGKVLAVLPAVMLGIDRAMCVQEVTAFMDGTALQVSGEPGRKRVSIGTIKNHRVNGSDCVDLNTGPNTPANCGVHGTPNLPIEQRSSCRLDFIEAARDRQVTWLDGAHLVRKRLPVRPSKLYDDAFVYGILVDQPLFETPTATFEQCETLIRQIAALTDGAKQIVHLWGFQYRGKDTGYPSVRVVNPRAGGQDGYRRLVERARALNCLVTLSDNYDDAYRSSPEWDDAIVARRPDGQLWESRNWTGENSYIVGLAKYMKGPGLTRITDTIERYRLPGTTHIDVLSYFSVRNDWDPAAPASGIKNLVEGRFRIIDEYRKRGIDVSSEGVRYAFMGKVSSCWVLGNSGPCPFGGTPVPMLATVYRQATTWGQANRAANFNERILKSYFTDGPVHTFFRASTDLRTITDNYYLMQLPWHIIHPRNITAFQRQGERTTISYEGNARADLDWATQAHSVVADGVEIARDGAVFAPHGTGRLAFYALTARELSHPLPAGWNAARLAAIALSPAKPREVAHRVEDGRIRLTVEAQQPVIVYRDGAAARRRLLG